MTGATGTLAPDSISEQLADAAALRALARRRLLPQPPPSAVDHAVPAERGDHDLNDASPAEIYGTGPFRRAAVLIPIVSRPDGPHVILTRRTEHLPNHAGQIAFPGGKIEAGDATPLAAALRETHEEIGIPPELIEPLGYLDTYQSGSGYRIVPVVGLVDRRAELVLDHGEVAAAFEVPLVFLMDPGNHQLDSREWRNRRRRFYVMPFEEHRIWGITAGIVRSLYDRLFGP